MVAFGESQVALEKSIIEKNREFFPTDAEHKGRQQTQIIASGTGTIFNVPVNNTLFITSAFITKKHFGVDTSNTDVLDITDPISGDSVALIGASISGSRSSDSNSISFPMPIKVTDDKRVDVGSGSIGGITGWLEPKKLFSN